MPVDHSDLTGVALHPPGDHASSHTDGSDDIQNATGAQKGLATAAQITKLNGIATGATDDTTVTAHLGDTTDAHDASAISFVPAGTVAATNVQAAIEEVASEGGGGGGWTAVDASETVKGIAELATQSETNTGTDDTRIVTPLKLKTNVDLHINDTTDAHDASAISVLDTTTQYAATNVEDALAEVLDGLQAHEADATDAHDASAISFSPTGTIAATNVQSAIAEVASEGGGGGTLAAPIPVITISNGFGVNSWGSMPSALTEVSGIVTNRKKADLTNATEARVSLYVSSAGHTTAEIRAQYSTDESTWAYLDASAGPAVNISATGAKVSSWVNLTGAAQADVFLRLVGINGNGSASPVFGLMQLEVR